MSPGRQASPAATGPARQGEPQNRYKTTGSQETQLRSSPRRRVYRHLVIRAARLVARVLPARTRMAKVEVSHQPPALRARLVARSIRYVAPQVVAHSNPYGRPGSSNSVWLPLALDCSRFAPSHRPQVISRARPLPVRSCRAESRSSAASFESCPDCAIFRYPYIIHGIRDQDNSAVRPALPPKSRSLVSRQVLRIFPGKIGRWPAHRVSSAVPALTPLALEALLHEP
jgi:hypothetical protein